jgi:cytochrome c oxidase cbb3-type subunit 4
MSYEQVASITQVGALLLFVAFFIGVLIYAFRPGNKKGFEEAARLPLEKDPGDEKKDG